MYFPIDGMLVHHRVIPSIKYAGTHLYTWVERGTASRICTGHGKPGKSWNFIISFSRPRKSYGVGHGKSWNISMLSMNESQ